MKKTLFLKIKPNIHIKIENPSLNAFTFFFPAILGLSKEGEEDIFKLFRFAFIGSSTQ